MRSGTIASVVCVLLLGSMAKSDLTKFPLCTEPGIQESPVMAGQVAVWSDQRETATGFDIYGYSFSEPNELTICTATGYQRFPAISGDFIVWQDERYGNKDIFGYDLRTRQEFPICLNGATQSNPDISIKETGKVIVWQDSRYGNTDILGYDLIAGQEIEICTNPSAQSYPAVDWPWVVWVDARNAGNGYDIYAKNLETGIEIPVCINSAEQFAPDVSNGLVVWQDKRNSATHGTDIYARQLPDGIEFPVCTELQNQSNPSIDGALIAWEDRRNGVDSDIYAYNLTTSNFIQVNSQTGAQTQPSVCGNRILWRHGDDIYYADVPVPTVLTVLWPNGGEMILAGTRIPILWRTEGPAPGFVKITFSRDGGQNWVILASAVPNTGVYEWTSFSDLDSSECLIRISDVTAPLTMDTSDAVFTVFQCDPALTADLTGDCVVDLEDFYSFVNQWLQCGNPYDSQWCFQID